MVTLRSFIACSSAAWVLGGVRLISSASSSWVKIGPLVSMKLLVWKLNRLVPRTSPGIRSGVNWMRPNCSDRPAAKALREQRLGGAGHALEQDVAADEQARQHQVDDLVLADHGLADLAAHALSDRADVADVHSPGPCDH